MLLPAPRAAVHRLGSVRVLSPRPFEPSEDVIRLIVDFATGTLLELLATALVDRHFHVVARQRLCHELRWLGTKPGARKMAAASTPDLMELLVPQVAQKFVDLPSLNLRSPGVTDDQACMEVPCPTFAPFGEDEALLHCQDCNTPLIKANDIISSNYRIMTGRAFLTSTAYNVVASEETQEAHYTTGQYTVRHVDCARCRLRVGITYVGALDRGNQYKIGKFLVGQHFFVRPTCCLLRTRPLPAELPTPLCPRCERNGARGVLHLVHRLTHGLNVCHTRQLYEQMLQERAAEALAVEGWSHQGGSARARSRSRAFMAWCLPLLRPPPASTNSAADLSGMRAAAPRGSSASATSAALPRRTPDLLLEAPQRLLQPGLHGELALHANHWQDLLKARLGMLSCLQTSIQQSDRLHSALSAVVRFIGVFCRVARRVAPLGSNAPDRVACLLQLLPALVWPDRSDALQGARALVLAVRKEWVVSSSVPAGSDPAGVIATAELEAIVAAITAHAASGGLGESQALSPAAEASPHAVAMEHGPAWVPRSSRAMPATGRVHGGSVASERSSPALVRQLSPSTLAPRGPSRSISPRLGLVAREADFTEDEPTITDSSSDDSEEVLQQEDESTLQCLACGVPILQVEDILSSSYRITTSPAYLTRQAHNVAFGEESHEVMYTSGQYTVRDIACACCAARLGVVYVGALNAVNQHKVGKFLMGQDRLLVPSGLSAPTDEAALHGQLLDLMRGHSGIQVPPPPEALAETRPTTPRARNVDSVSPEHTPSVSPIPTQTAIRAVSGPPFSTTSAASVSVATAPIQEQGSSAAEERELSTAVTTSALQSSRPSQQLMVVVKRYMRCILPAAQSGPAALPRSASMTVSQATAPSVVVASAPANNAGAIRMRASPPRLTAMALPAPAHAPLRVLRANSVD